MSPCGRKGWECIDLSADLSPRYWHQRFCGSFMSKWYLLNQLAGSYQNCRDISLGLDDELIRFWGSWPNFQDHCWTKTVKVTQQCTWTEKSMTGCPFLEKTLFFSSYFHQLFAWRHIVFGMDPVGVSVGVKLLVRSVTWIPFGIFWWYLVEM